MKVYLVTLLDMYNMSVTIIDKVFSTNDLARKWVDEVFLLTFTNEILSPWTHISEEVEKLSLLESVLPNKTYHLNILIRPVLLDDMTKPDNIFARSE